MKFLIKIFYRSPLNFAIEMESIEIVKLLLANKNIDVNFGVISIY